MNPAYLAIDPNRQYLYCVNEGKNADNQGDTISAFSIQPKTGMLTFLNRQPAEGEAPCHISIDRDGRYVLVANYSSGTVCVYPIQAHGQLGETSQVIQHQGPSQVNSLRGCFKSLYTLSFPSLGPLS